MQHISPTQLKQRLDNPNTAQPVLLDVRESWEFEYCHISGSILIPMGHISTSLDRLNPKDEIVLICHHGIRSRQVAYYLEHMGFEHVINLDGGVERWADEVEPQMRRY